jgi:hypothetical protein
VQVKIIFSLQIKMQFAINDLAQTNTIKIQQTLIYLKPKTQTKQNMQTNPCKQQKNHTTKAKEEPNKQTKRKTNWPKCKSYHRCIIH